MKLLSFISVRIYKRTIVTKCEILWISLYYSNFDNVSIYVKSLGIKYPKGFFYNTYLSVIYHQPTVSASFMLRFDFHLHILFNYFHTIIPICFETHFSSNRNLMNAFNSSHGCYIYNDLPDYFLFCVLSLLLCFF